MSAYLSSACLAERLCLCTWATRESGVVQSIPSYTTCAYRLDRIQKTTESALPSVRVAKLLRQDLSLELSRDH